MSTDCRERIVFLDQRQRILISSLRCHFQITLDCNVRRTGCLARSCTGVITVDAVFITIILIPHLRSPFFLRWKDMFWIFHIRTVFSAEFLSKFYCTCRTVFHTSSAGYAVLCLNLSNIGRAGHIRCIK